MFLAKIGARFSSCNTSRSLNSLWRNRIFSSKTTLRLFSSDTPLIRTNIGIFGAMNAGKSTLMNQLTSSETSIVDSTPGTTADTKISLLEIHRIGPTKVFDTPGIDECGELGEKKRQKAYTCLRESDVAIVVIDPFSPDSIRSADRLLAKIFQEKTDKKRKTMIVFNLREDHTAAASPELISSTVEEVFKHIPSKAVDLPSIQLNLTQPDASSKLTTFIGAHVAARQSQVPLLPPVVEELGDESVVLLNIPMDEETPSGRLLRPQALSQEALIRRFVGTFAYRMHLGKARAQDGAVVAAEKLRWCSTLDMLRSRLGLIITDSQAMDKVYPWLSEYPDVPLTTFSIMMANYLSGGRLELFVEGTKRFQNLRSGDRVLICEACQHDRIVDDIGTIQIPNLLKRLHGDRVSVDFAFGREYQSKRLTDYDLILHCGGCMLDQQKMNARLVDMEASGVAVSNYGLVLSYAQSPEALERVLKPWNIDI